MPELAPVTVFGYDRPEAMSRLLESLAANTLAASTRVRVFVDGPRAGADGQRQHAVANVAASFTESFAALEVVRAPANRGLARSIIGGVTDVLQNSDRIIVLEDDLVVAPDLLEYMNSALERYEGADTIGAIAGYSLELSSAAARDVYFHPRPTSWGWATWGDRWSQCDWQPAFDGLRSRFRLWRQLRRAGPDIYRMFRHYERGVVDSWAVRWTVHCVRHGLLSVYPSTSRIENEGFGEDATNCQGDNPYASSFVGGASRPTQWPEAIALDARIVREFNGHYSLSRKLAARIGRRGSAGSP